MSNHKVRFLSLRSFFVILAILGAIVISGCNTMRGLGEDTEDAGEAIQDAAR